MERRLQTSLEKSGRIFWVSRWEMCESTRIKTDPLTMGRATAVTVHSVSPSGTGSGRAGRPPAPGGQRVGLGWGVTRQSPSHGLLPRSGLATPLSPRFPEDKGECGVYPVGTSGLSCHASVCGLPLRVSELSMGGLGPTAGPLLGSCLAGHGLCILQDGTRSPSWNSGNPSPAQWKICS